MAEQARLGLGDPPGAAPPLVAGAWARRVTEQVLRTHRHVLSPKDPLLMIVTTMEVLVEEHATRVARDAARQREEGLAAVRLEVAAARSLLEGLVNEAAPHLIEQMRLAAGQARGATPPQPQPPAHALRDLAIAIGAGAATGLLVLAIGSIARLVQG